MYDTPNRFLDRFAGVIVGLAVGIVLGAGAIFWLDSGRLADADRIAGEYDQLRGAIAADRERIDSQAGIVEQRIENIGRGLSEVADIARRAGSQSLGIVETLKELARNLKEIQGRIRTLEDDHNHLRGEYRTLRGLAALEYEQLTVDNPQDEAALP